MTFLAKVPNKGFLRKLLKYPTWFFYLKNRNSEETKKFPKTLKQWKLSQPSLPPSSVEAETCLSAVGLFITKLRSSLVNEIIDYLFRGDVTRRLTRYNELIIVVNYLSNNSR